MRIKYILKTKDTKEIYPFIYKSEEIKMFYNPQIGDVIKQAGNEYYVLDNFGSKGNVCPIGETFYITNFRWQFDGEDSKFIRKMTSKELENFALKVTA